MIRVSLLLASIAATSALPARAMVPWAPGDVHPVVLLTLHGRADYVHGTNTPTDEPLPLMPPLSGAVGAEVAQSETGWAGRSYVDVETEMLSLIHI